MLFVSNGPGNGPHNPSMGRVLSEADFKMAWDGIKEGLGHERLIDKSILRWLT